MEIGLNFHFLDRSPRVPCVRTTQIEVNVDLSWSFLQRYIQKFLTFNYSSKIYSHHFNFSIEYFANLLSQQQSTIGSINIQKQAFKHLSKLISIQSQQNHAKGLCFADTNAYSIGFSCTQCKQIICYNCAIERHSNHSLESIGYQKTFLCQSQLQLDSKIEPFHFFLSKRYIKSLLERNLVFVNPSTSIQAEIISKSLIKTVFEALDNETHTLVGKYPLVEISPITGGQALKIRTGSQFDFEMKQRFDVDINETTTEGFRVEDIERMYPNQITVFYFEVKVEFGGMYDQIAIGLSNDDAYPFNEYAGYKKGSVAYHSDDGSIYQHGKLMKGYPAPRYGTNDIIGCGITASGDVFFTFNGYSLQLITSNFEGNVYPIVSMRGRQTKISITQLNLSKVNMQEKQKLTRSFIDNFSMKFNPNFKVPWNQSLIRYLIKENPSSILNAIINDQTCPDPEFLDLKAQIYKQTNDYHPQDKSPSSLVLLIALMNFDVKKYNCLLYQTKTMKTIHRITISLTINNNCLIIATPRQTNQTNTQCKMYQSLVLLSFKRLHCNNLLLENK